MIRDYNNADKIDDAAYFTGVEVEKTLTFGLKTLFVVGQAPAEEIVQVALQRNCKAIYFGANQSFDLRIGATYEEWEAWVSMIKAVLANKARLWCTLDFDVTLVEDFLETGLAENNRMIPMVSVKMPYIEQLGYNAVVKIDDKGFDRTNPGVWCHSIQTATHPSAFTHWQKYNEDELVMGIVSE